MRSLLIALAGFLAGSVAVAGLLLALPESSATVSQAPAALPGSMARSMGRMAAAATASPSAMMAGARLAKLTIQHVERGCHVWSNGRRTAATMSLRLQPGEKLAVMDMDVDAHQLLELSGPAHLQLGAPMMMDHGVTVSFARPGVYHLATKTVPMPGQMDVKTIGPDNRLRLTVTVA